MTILLKRLIFTLKNKVLYKGRAMDENSALDEIKFIKKIIEDSKQTTIDDGKGYIFWGIMVTIGMLVNYFIYILNIKINFIWIWVVLISLGWLYNIVFFFSGKKKKPSNNFARKMLYSIWLSCGIAMTLIGFIGVFSGAISGEIVSPILSSIIGIGLMLSGFVYDLNWVKYLSAGWWVGAIIMFIYPGVQSMLIMSFMMMAFLVLPGVIIYQNFKKEIALTK